MEPHMEARGGMDGGAGGHADRGRGGIEGEGEAALQHSERYDGFKESELVSDTFTAPAAEGKVREVRCDLHTDTHLYQLRYQFVPTGTNASIWTLRGLT
jgi:hypothetical protein